MKKHYSEIPFKTRFRKIEDSRFVGKVPQWWSNIHFDVHLVHHCFPVKSFIPEENKRYKVLMTSLGAKRTTVKVKEVV